MIRQLTTLAFALLAISSFAQAPTDHLPKQHQQKISVSNAPVTQAEAYAMFQKVEKAFRAINGISEAGPASTITPSSAPITRDRTIVEMARLYDLVHPKFTIKLRTVLFDPAVFTLHDKTAKAEASKLVAAGCIGKYSQLVAGSGNTMTVGPFGDAVGLFISRIAEFTHVPSSRFSPYLKSGR